MSDAFERHARMLRDQAFDVCELSMSSYLMARQRGQALQAIPVFPYRMFRHSFILINREAGIARPPDLLGKRVGTPMYQTTTALWVRGHMAHEWGVTPDQVRWYTEMPELVGFQAPPGVVIHQVGSGELEPMLLRGELDALVLIEEVPAELLAAPQVVRLFPDYVAVEREFYRRTRIFPMMHALVARESLLREQPGLAASLREAFEAAKQLALDQLRYPRTSTLVWAGAYREAEVEVFGHDPYVFGLEANRAALEALVTYSHEQGLTARPFAIEELFVPDVG
jgi:4,5-dihydroxyphthalate decarboxylase